MLSLPQRSQIIAAVCIAVFFAIPMVTLISCMVIFPIFFYGALAIFVNAGLLALPLVYGLQQLGLHTVKTEHWHTWMLSVIVWIGCAFGFANWGLVGSTMGAKNQPFLDVFFSPILMLLGFPIG